MPKINPFDDDQQSSKDMIDKIKTQTGKINSNKDFSQNLPYYPLPKEKNSSDYLDTMPMPQKPFNEDGKNPQDYVMPLKKGGSTKCHKQGGKIKLEHCKVNTAKTGKKHHNW
jgi:hypothetical protein